MTAKLNDDQRKQLKHNIMSSFIQLLEDTGHNKDPDIKDAYDEIKSELAKQRTPIICRECKNLQYENIKPNCKYEFHMNMIMKVCEGRIS